jgi:hypothetical protein
MAAPADVKTIPTMKDDGNQDVSQLKIQFNNLVTQLRTLCTKLDNDAGVTDTNYFALICDSAVTTAPAKVVNRS